MKLRLTSRIALSFVLFAAVLLAVVGWLTYRAATENLKAAATSEIVGVAIEKAAALETWFEERRSDLKQLQADAVLANKTASLAAAATPEERLSARADLVAELESRLNGPGTDYLELLVLDPGEGKVVASSRAIEVGQSKIAQPYFVQGKSDLFLQGPYLGPDYPGKIMTAGMPIRTGDGRLVGVLAARLEFAALSAIVRGWTGLYRTEDAYLVNADRDLLTERRLIGETAVLHRKIDTEAVRRCLAGQSGVVTGVDYRGVPVLTVFRWLEKEKIGLLIEIDQAEVMAPVRSFGRSFLSIGLVALAAATGLAFFLARTITRPLRALHDRVRSFAEKRTGEPVPAGSGDEVDLLAREFKEMVVRVQEHTNELTATNQDLHSAKEAAEIANRTKGEFLASMSHEVQTSMSGVIGMTDQLLHTGMTPDQRNVAESIQMSSSALLSVIHDIEDFSLIEAGDLELETDDFDPRQVIRTSVEFLSGAAQLKALQLQVRIEEPFPAIVRGDARRFRQVLINLLGNAIKFTPRGEVTLHAAVEDETEQTVTLRVAVADSGRGLNNEAQYWLSRTFKESNGISPRKHGGKGLGLLICKQLVAKMQGDIGVESALGKGSTFWFTVRMAKQEKGGVRANGNSEH